MRWIKRLGGGVLLLIALAAVAVAVYVWRSLPQLSGSLQAAGLQQAVQIKRDASDVTHIFAQTDTDAAFALGYTHAQERSWQLETNRRVMHGLLSEVFGAATLETDQLMRSLGIIRAAQKQFDALPTDAKAILEAYTKGINSFHANSSQALPPEFHVLGIKPAAWQPADSMGWSLMMALDLGGNWGVEFARLSAAQKVPTAQLWQLFPAYPGEQPASKVDFSKLYADLGIFRDTIKTGALRADPTPPTAQFDIKNVIKNPFLTAPVDLAALSRDVGNIEGKGSNNWVVAGSHSTSGKPLLANDPHLGLGAPAIWYFTRMQSKASGMDVIGASLPGLPFIVLGRTAQVAWGFTNTGPDVQDLYIERINPANPAQYQTPEGWKDFETRTESIPVKGSPTVSYTYRATRHGPVVSDAQSQYAETIDQKKYAIALRWSALDADNRTTIAGWSSQKAKTVAELFKAYEDYHSPMQNVVAADSAGVIAYKAIGKFPIRKPDNDIRGIAPAPGWDAKYDWAGYVPYAQTPSDDGKKGWISTANQRIHAPDFPHFMGQDWATPERFDRIEALLSASPKHDMASMQRIHADTLSTPTKRLLPILQKTASNHPLAAAAQEQLKGFDGDMKAASAAPLIFAAWADEVARGIVTPKLGEEKFKRLYGKRHFRGVVDQVMLGSDPAVSAYWCAPQSCADVSSAALARALDKIQATQGADVKAWNWGAAHVARSIHRPFGNVAPLAKYFDVTVPTGGDPWTVNVGQYWLNEKSPYQNRHAASLRHVFDLADLEKSGFMYQTGQSGLVWSRRYRDMSEGWAAVQYRPLQLAPATFASELVLNPK
ncbi:penicillin acylase family protein [Variovorax sp. PCZ-1]|uniref:penicillin acylase family protein n=1 Tax=Variovorax sp. PCZ-1 TaxID=2835533 RepID=UPI001BD1AA20|nr:penicillin acylase family protein [Variovorax sp. PCZ-1]MBS7807328.1 penicillin acylase family protein [Variovorax sp. PCZ-1]